MKRYVFLYLAFFVFFGISAADAACPCDPQIRRQLEDKVASDGVVKVIVGFDTKFTPEGKLEGRGAFLQRNAIANARTRLVESMPASVFAGVRFVVDYATIPYVALEVDPDALAFLLDSPLITSIEEDIPVPPSLAESVPLIQGDQAWAVGATGSGQVVAILDTGVSKTHPFLSGKVVAEGCYSTTNAEFSCESVCPGGAASSDASGSGVNCDPSIEGCGHGTHVAGIAAGKGSESSGVAKDANIIAIQVFSKFVSFDYCAAPPCALSFTSDQIGGLERVYALRDTYDIAAVNMSLGGGAYSADCDGDSRKAIIDNLRSVGIATVISSGNNGFLGYIGAPSCISSSVSVGATTKTDTVAYYSNSSALLKLLAPGSGIRSSVPGGTYESWNGTSMAAPHVTGAWAVVKSRYPDATVSEILDALTRTGTMIEDYGYTMPRVNIMSAITYLGQSDPRTVSGDIASSCDLCFRHIPVDILSSDAATLLFTIHTDNDGVFEAGLSAGEYRIRPRQTPDCAFEPSSRSVTVSDSTIRVPSFVVVSGCPTPTPTPVPTVAPTSAPGPEPTAEPTRRPTVMPTVTPTPRPSVSPTRAPEPSPLPEATVTPRPTLSPAPEVSPRPTEEPLPTDTPRPTPTGAQLPSPSPVEAGVTGQQTSGGDPELYSLSGDPLGQQRATFIRNSILGFGGSGGRGNTAGDTARDAMSRFMGIPDINESNANVAVDPGTLVRASGFAGDGVLAISVDVQRSPSDDFVRREVFMAIPVFGAGTGDRSMTEFSVLVPVSGKERLSHAAAQWTVARRFGYSVGDDGSFDEDGDHGSISTEYYVVRVAVNTGKTPTETPGAVSGGGGCAAGIAPAVVVLLALPLLLARGKK